MGNMSYCRFENTLPDLRDCYDAMDEDTGELSESEKRSRRAIIKLACRIADDFGDELDE